MAGSSSHVPMPAVIGAQENERIQLSQIRTSSQVLFDFGAREDITSVESLISALNSETDSFARSILRRWIGKHISWFKQHGTGSTDASIVEAYAGIARIRTRDKKDKTLLKSFFIHLCQLVGNEMFGEQNLIKALCTALHCIELTVMKLVGFSELEKLLHVLLSKLSPSTTFSRDTFEAHKYTLEAVHQTLIVMESVVPRGNGSLGRGQSYDHVLAGIRDVKRRATFYPFVFHSVRIERILERWKEERVIEHDLFKSSRMWRSLYGLAYLQEKFTNAHSSDVHMISINVSVERLRESLARRQHGSLVWDDLLDSFAAAVSLATEDAAKIALFDETYQIVTQNEKYVDDLAKRQILRYGIIDLLQNAATQHICAALSRRAEALLLEMQTTISVLCSTSKWISEAYFDALQAIYPVSDNREAVIALGEEFLRSGNESLRASFVDWLGDESVEDKMAEFDDEEESDEGTNLFDLVKREAGIQVTHSDITQSLHELQLSYQHIRFAEVSPIFPGEVRKHVREFEHDLAYYQDVALTQEGELGDEVDEHKWQGIAAKHVKEEDQLEEHYKKKTRVRKSITLDEIFTKEKINIIDEDAKVVKRVLVYGDPGSGKTSISKKIAYNWAVGKWGLEFERLYHLEMRALKATKYDDGSTRREISLETAIANICFSRKNNATEYRCLVEQIHRDVMKETTLIILDGIDECSEEGREIEAQAIRCESKLLLFSRPYNLTYERDIADLEVECLGLSNTQLHNYINNELREGKGDFVLSKIRENPDLWRAAHIPVTAQIVCYVYKEHIRKRKELEMRNDMHSMYTAMVTSTWTRYVEKYGRHDLNRSLAFRALERIAFKAFRDGQILIDQDSVNQQSASGGIMHAIRNSGLLLLALEGYHFQFPHLTFQEYFAGMYLSHQAFDTRSKLRDEAVSWITKNKYLPKARVLLAFATQARFALKGIQGLMEMRSLLDQQPVEIMGMQQLTLQLRCLDACLAIEQNQQWSEILTNEDSVAIVDKATAMVEVLSEDMSGYGRSVLSRVVSSFGDMPYLIKHKPNIIVSIVDRIKSTAATGGVLVTNQYMQIAKHSNVLVARVGEIAIEGLKSSYWRFRRAAVETLTDIVDAAPNNSEDAVEVLFKACSDSDSDVRRASVEGQKTIATSVPQYASAAIQNLVTASDDAYTNVRIASVEALEVIVTSSLERASEVVRALLQRYNDKDADVRRASLNALNNIFGASTEHATAAMTALLKGCEDSDSVIRRASVEVVGTTTAKLANHAPAALKVLLKTCDDSVAHVRRTAVESVKQTVVASPQQVPKAMDTVLKTCSDKDLNVRLASVETLTTIVALSPKVLPRAVKAVCKTCDDVRSVLRLASVKALQKIAAISPEQSAEVMEALLKRCEDNVDYIVKASIEAIKTISVHSSSLSNEAIKALLRAHSYSKGNDRFVHAKDSSRKESEVQHAVIETLKETACTSTDRASAVMNSLFDVCGEGNSKMREASVYALSSITAELPIFASVALDAVLKTCDDVQVDTRCAAVKALTTIASVSQQHTSKAMNALLRKCDDKASRVVHESVKALKTVVAVTPEMASTALETSVKTCSYRYGPVRVASIESIAAIVALRPGYCAAAEKALLDAFNDSDNSLVKEATIRAFKTMVVATPEYSKAAVKPVLRALNDLGYNDVIRVAVEAVGVIVSIAPTHAPSAIDAILKLSFIELKYAQLTWARTLRTIIVADPTQASKAIDPIHKTYDDGGLLVRLTLVETLRDIIAADPAEADKLIATVFKACNDDEREIRQTAVKTLEFIHTRAPNKTKAAIERRLREGDVKNSNEILVAIGAEATVNTPSEGLSRANRVKPFKESAKEIAKERKTADIVLNLAAPPERSVAEIKAWLKVCNDGDWYVRRDAIKNLKASAAAASQNAPTMIRAMLKAASEGDAYIQHATVEAIGATIAASPEQVHAALETVFDAYDDGNSPLSPMSVEALKVILTTAPRQSEYPIRCVVAACDSTDLHSSWKAISGVKAIVTASSKHTEAGIRAIFKSCRHRNSVIRHAGVEALRAIVAAAPSYSSIALRTVLDRCRDEDTHVSQASIETLESIISSSPHLAAEAFFQVRSLHNCDDHDFAASIRRLGDSLTFDQAIQSLLKSKTDDYELGHLLEHVLSYEAIVVSGTLSNSDVQLMNRSPSGHGQTWHVTSSQFDALMSALRSFLNKRGLGFLDCHKC